MKETINIQSLRDEELNRAMIWLNPPKRGVAIDDPCDRVYFNGPYDQGCWPIEYLSDWSLTGPLMVEYGIGLDTDNLSGSCYISWNGSYQTGLVSNPLRAICECVLMVELAKGRTA